ncbi:hypothetical protein LTR05_008483 [Lithohypha guttulata]|uniref:Uncharacterized protein n=1 Tax=Lithohypha guttulata TaxID=1690604 RepID=A0AAN7Q7I0_9EURO|nr:hypothetical protein LTR05_008483 [Lithohypha guttulata]
MYNLHKHTTTLFIRDNFSPPFTAPFLQLSVFTDNQLNTLTRELLNLYILKNTSTTARAILEKTFHRLAQSLSDAARSHYGLRSEIRLYLSALLDGLIPTDNATLEPSLFTQALPHTDHHLIFYTVKSKDASDLMQIRIYTLQALLYALRLDPLEGLPPRSPVARSHISTTTVLLQVLHQYTIGDFAKTNKLAKNVYVPEPRGGLTQEQRRAQLRRNKRHLRDVRAIDPSATPRGFLRGLDMVDMIAEHGHFRF